MVGEESAFVELLNDCQRALRAPDVDPIQIADVKPMHDVLREEFHSLFHCYVSFVD